ncbi:unnamed protein product [Caenorhabditis sp. 36 PRJEB53466]|nr:unnamed protein product [Caenorhabditis sp. 36 PRJEB53466]
MSALNDPSHGKQHSLRASVSLNSLRVAVPLEETCNDWQSPFQTVAGVPWKFALRRTAENRLKVVLTCFCDTRLLYKAKARMRVTFVHRVPEFSQTIEENFVFGWKQPTHIAARDFNWIELHDQGFLDANYEQNTVDFNIEVSGAMSTALGPPVSDHKRWFHDLCIKVDDATFFVSTVTLKMRCRFHERITDKAVNGEVHLDDENAEDFREWLKLLNQYTSDINAKNVSSLLRISQRYGAEQCVNLLEKFLLRSKQMHVMEKLELVQKYRLNKLRSVFVASIETAHKKSEYARRAEFKNLPTVTQNQIHTVLPDPDCSNKPYDGKLEIFVAYGVRDGGGGEIEKSAIEVIGELRWSAWAVAETPNCYEISVRCEGPPEVTDYFHASFICSVDVLGDGELARPAHYNTRSSHLFVDTHNPTTKLMAPRNAADIVENMTIRVKITVTDAANDCQIVAAENQLFTHSDEPFVNAELVLDNDAKLYVHKEILAEASPFFEAMFKSSPQNTHRIEGVEQAVMEEGLQHIYFAGRNIQGEEFDQLEQFITRFRSDRVTEEMDIYMVRTPYTDRRKIAMAQKYLFTNTLLSCTERVHGSEGMKLLATKEFEVPLVGGEEEEEEEEGEGEEEGMEEEEEEEEEGNDGDEDDDDDGQGPGQRPRQNRNNGNFTPEIGDFILNLLRETNPTNLDGFDDILHYIHGAQIRFPQERLLEHMVREANHLTALINLIRARNRQHVFVPNPREPMEPRAQVNLPQFRAQFGFAQQNPQNVPVERMDFGVGQLYDFIFRMLDEQFRVDMNPAPAPAPVPAAPVPLDPHDPELAQAIQNFQQLRDYLANAVPVPIAPAPAPEMDLQDRQLNDLHRLAALQRLANLAGPAPVVVGPPAPIINDPLVEQLHNMHRVVMELSHVYTGLNAAAALPEQDPRDRRLAAALMRMVRRNVNEVSHVLTILLRICTELTEAIPDLLRDPHERQLHEIRQNLANVIRPRVEEDLDPEPAPAPFGNFDAPPDGDRRLLEHLMNLNPIVAGHIMHDPNPQEIPEQLILAPAQAARNRMGEIPMDDNQWHIELREPPNRGDNDGGPQNGRYRVYAHGYAHGGQQPIRPPLSPPPTPPPHPHPELAHVHEEDIDQPDVDPNRAPAPDVAPVPIPAPDAPELQHDVMEVDDAHE